VHGTPLQLAALIASIGSLISIVSCPIGGMISDRIGSRKRPYLVGMIFQSLAMPLYAVLPVGGIVGLASVQGMVTGLIPTNIFAAGVEATGDERLGGLAMGIIMVGQNAGSLIGPVLFGSLVESFGWTTSILCGAALGALAIIAGALARVK
jgi:MFS family permease